MAGCRVFFLFIQKIPVASRYANYLFRVVCTGTGIQEHTHANTKTISISEIQRKRNDKR